MLQAETQLKTTQAQAIDIGVQRAQLEHAIALLIGKAPADLTIAAAPLATQPPTIPVGVPAELLKRRPDVAAAERTAASANAQIGVAEAAYYPTLSIDSQGGFESSSASKWLSAMGRFWSAGFSLSQTLFDGGARKAQVEQARAVYDSDVRRLPPNRAHGLPGSRRQCSGAADSRHRGASAGRSRAGSAAIVGRDNESIPIRIVSYLNVVVAQTTALANERTAVDILGRRLTASVLLIKALGGGWQAPA